MKVKKGMILAAGFGRRMMPITEKIPKPLLKIGKVTLLENCILKLKDFGIEEVVINTHYLSNQIKYYLNEKNYDLIDVHSCDEAFVTGTFAGIIPVIEIDNIKISNNKRGKITKLLQTLYKKKLIELYPR